MTTTTIDCTPSPAAAKRMLQMIIDRSSDASDVDWARSEMLRCFPDNPVDNLYLVQDGRDTSRLVTVMGQEVRTVTSPKGRIIAVLPLEGNTELDSFTPDEWDLVLAAGTEHVLDAIAGTTYTIINW